MYVNTFFHLPSILIRICSYLSSFERLFRITDIEIPYFFLIICICQKKAVLLQPVYLFLFLIFKEK